MAVEDPPISELRAQRPRAVGVLVDRHYGRIHRYLLRLVGDAALAEELTQDTFLRAYLALPRLADGSNVSAWLFRIATNAAREHRRRQRVGCWPRLPYRSRAADQLRGHVLGDVGDAGFEDQVARQDLVQRALGQLPPDQRACLMLYAWTGYTCAEIGQIVGRSTDAVRMLLVRARRRFRAAYGDRIEPDGEGNYGATAAGGAPRPGAGRAGGGDARRMDDQRDHGSRCERIQEDLPFYPRGDLPRDTFSAVTRHLGVCLRCRAALLDVQATYRLLQRHLNTAHLGEAGEARAAIVARLGALAADVPAGFEPLEEPAPPVMAPVPVPVRSLRQLQHEPPPWAALTC